MNDVVPVTISLLHSIGDRADDNIDVDVILSDGSHAHATFFTLKNLETLMLRHRLDGECLEGRYFWASGMIVVAQLTEQLIKEAVWDMCRSGEITSFIV